MSHVFGSVDDTTEALSHTTSGLDFLLRQNSVVFLASQLNPQRRSTLRPDHLQTGSLSDEAALSLESCYQKETFSYEVI